MAIVTPLSSCDGPAPSESEDDVNIYSDITALIVKDNVWTIGKATDSGVVGTAIQTISNTPLTATGCPDHTENPISVNRDYDLSIFVVVDDESKGPSRVCIPQWSTDVEIYPGTTFDNRIYLEDLRDSEAQICGSCVGKDGKVLPNTTIVFRLLDPTD